MPAKPSLDAILMESRKLRRDNAERKRVRRMEEVIKREIVERVVVAIRKRRVTDHDKELIRELSKDRSVNFIAEKMELDLVLTAAIIDGIV